MTGGIVFDASVMLNILGSGHARTVLTAIPGRKIVVDVTTREVLRDPLEPKSRVNPLDSLRSEGFIEHLELPEAAFARFVELVGAAPPDDLDDGEAAALSVGELFGLAVAIDEAKGRRVAAAVLPTVQLVSSSAIFAEEKVGRALGGELVDAIFAALTNARMRVLGEHDRWVRDLLGPARVAQCPSLRRRR